MKAIELREKSVDELQKELLALLKEQFNLTMQMSTGQMARPHLIRAARRSIARIKTVVAEKTKEKGGEA